jgi:hypothetical protein
VTTTYNRAIRFSSFSLPQYGKHAVKKQGASKGDAGLQGQYGHQTVFKHRLNYDKRHCMADAHSKKEKLLAQRQKLDAEIKAIEAKERSQRRKDDTRRKIILGGLVMKAAASEPNILNWLNGLASGQSVTSKDRDLLDLWFEENAQKKEQLSGASHETRQAGSTALADRFSD